MTLQGSNDNSNWTTLDTVAEKRIGLGGKTWSYTPDSVGEYRWYKLVFTANNGDNTLGIGEIELKVRKGLYGFRPTSRSTRPRPTIKYSQVASISGRDIRFTDSTGGTLLPYQFDGWNPGADSYAWVKIPEVKPSSEGNTTIKMWWGNENAVTEFPSHVNNGEVWSSYAARWNMDDEEGPTILDSSPNRNHGQKTEVTSTPSGVLGIQNFPVTGRTDGIKIPGSPNFDLGSSFTGSMWMKFEGTAVTTGNTNDINYHRIFKLAGGTKKSVSKL